MSVIPAKAEILLFKNLGTSRGIDLSRRASVFRSASSRFRTCAVIAGHDEQAPWIGRLEVRFHG